MMRATRKMLIRAIAISIVVMEVRYL